VERREFLARVGRFAVPAAALGLAAGIGADRAYDQRQLDDLGRRLAQSEQAAADLRAAVDREAVESASGGGVNLKYMQDPLTGQPTVPMEEVFSFDRHHAMCRVDANPKAFTMKTYKLGEAHIKAYEFYMAMMATSIKDWNVAEQPDGTRKCSFSGGLACTTLVGDTSVRFAGKDLSEPSTFRIEAVDAGVGPQGDSFSFTAFFDPAKAPNNFAIFGPQATFTGKMVAGDITIPSPRR
jgi:hypothetical protein